MLKFPDYLDEYGGINSVVKSSYFWAATLTTVLASRYFLAPKWWDVVLSVVPGLVGFSIAGVAIFISLGNDGLRSVFAGRRPSDPETKSSPFMKFMAMFTHFIIVQLLALVFAFLAKSFYDASAPPYAILTDISDNLKAPFWLISGLLFLYSIFLSMSLALEIYRLARMIDQFQTVQNKKNSDGARQAPRDHTGE